MLALAGLAPGPVASAASPDPGQAAGTRLAAAAVAIAAATANVQQLQSRPPAASAIDQLRADLRLAEAQFATRQAIRDEQVLVYALAGRPDQEASVLVRLPAAQAAAVGQVTAGLRAIWRLAGVDDITQVRPRQSRRFGAAEPVEALLGYYRSAAARSGVDWSYLAAINYVESDFGRVLGPSGAGALGPMQFLPSTWLYYGGGGDIMSPRDSILAASRLLARNGAPADYDRAIFSYNHDRDYVTAVESYAAAMRTDPAWLTRLYYWSTYG